MKKNNIKLVYSSKYNQYYFPTKFDEETGICRVHIYSKSLKGIDKTNIASYENDEDWKFIIEENHKFTAEEWFLKLMNGTDYKAMRKVIKNFRANGLIDSELAMNELTRWYNMGFKEIRSEKEKLIRQRVQALYNNVCTANTKNISRKGYKQHIPVEIKDEAYSKGLIIERNDDFYYNTLGKKVAAHGRKKEDLQRMRDCGYRIVNTQGRVIIGDGFSLNDAQAVEFVQKYNPVPEDLDGSYQVALTKNQVEKLQKVEKFLKAHNFAVKNNNNLRFWITTKNGHVVNGGINGMAYATFLRCAYELKASKGWK